MKSLLNEGSQIAKRGFNGPGAAWSGFEGRRTNGDGEREVARRIQQTIDFMLQHPDQPLQVARLASLANVSSSHYFVLFKRLTGRTPIDFFIRLRMNRACQLLDSTSLGVKEVAAALGYEDPFYFSRVFKSVNRIAPSDYRSLPADQRVSIRSASLPESPCVLPNERSEGRTASTSGTQDAPSQSARPARAESAEGHSDHSAQATRPARGSRGAVRFFNNGRCLCTAGSV